MKRTFTLLSVAALAFAFTSCEKCATCTTISDDPQTEGEELQTDVCGVGREYTDQVTIYERNNWTCSEQE